MKDINKSASYALERLVASGASKGQCIARATDTLELTAEGGELAQLRNVGSKTDVTLTAFVDNKTGASSAGSLEQSAIDACARESVTLASSARGDDARAMNESGEQITLENAPGGAQADALIERMSEFLSFVRENHPSIKLRRASAEYESGVEIYKNTAGTTIINPIGVYHVSATFIARVGDKMSSFSSYNFSSGALDTPFADAGLFRQMLQNCENQVDTRAFGEKKVGTLVIAPQCLSVFMSQIAGAFMASPALISGVSRWRNSIGEAVADERFSLTSAPRDKRFASTRAFTPDGFFAEDQSIIEKGKLISLLPDLYTANKTGLERAKSYGGSYVIESGAQGLDEIIAGIEDGVLMYRFSGGMPQASGDFSGIAKNSFIIKNGKIAYAAKETTVSGNMADMLKNLRAISSESVANGSYVMPYAAFDEITIR